MAIPAHTTGPGTLKLGEAPTELAVACTKALLKPSVETDDDVYVLSGDVITGEDNFTWELEVTLFQSFDAEGLTDFLFKERGKVHPFTFKPNNDHAQEWTGNVKVRPMDIGGDVKKRNTSDVTFPLVGEPEVTYTT